VATEARGCALGPVVVRRVFLCLVEGVADIAEVFLSPRVGAVEDLFPEAIPADQYLGTLDDNTFEVDILVLDRAD
jgi:hypothetical protein